MTAPAPLPHQRVAEQESPLPLVTTGDHARSEEVAEPENPGLRVQPVPDEAACAVPPESGISQERSWLRTHLGERYDAAAGAVARVMAESPGLRAGRSAPSALGDLVAVFVFLSGSAGPIDDEVRRGVPGPHLPFARCIASGLRQLPTYRGATMLRAMLTEEERAWYREGAAVTEWGFCSALTTGRPGLPGNTDILIWSRTARRTALMDPQVSDRVLFLPGTAFKVLKTSEGERHQIMLRELASSESAENGEDAGGRVALDDIALTGLASAAATAQSAQGVEAVPEAYKWAFSAPPGLIGTGRPTADPADD